MVSLLSWFVIECLNHSKETEGLESNLVLRSVLESKKQHGRGRQAQDNVSLLV